MINGIVALLSGLALVAVLSGVAYAVIRFGVISRRRTRGSEQRLRRPDVSGVEKIVGFPPPARLVEVFQSAPYVERQEFVLVDEGHEPARTWEIGGFIPLSPVDVQEARALHGLRDGIPIAEDPDGGLYVVLPSGAVVLRSRSLPDGDAVVCERAEELLRFVARES